MFFPRRYIEVSAKGMLQALENHAIASGVEHIDVVSTIPAKAFYERNGYVSNGAPKHVGRIIGDFRWSRACHLTSGSAGRRRLRGRYRRVPLSAKFAPSPGK